MDNWIEPSLRHAVAVSASSTILALQLDSYNTFIMVTRRHLPYLPDWVNGDLKTLHDRVLSRWDVLVLGRPPSIYHPIKRLILLGIARHIQQSPLFEEGNLTEIQRMQGGIKPYNPALSSTFARSRLSSWAWKERAEAIESFWLMLGIFGHEGLIEVGTPLEMDRDRHFIPYTANRFLAATIQRDTADLAGKCRFFREPPPFVFVEPNQGTFSPTDHGKIPPGSPEDLEIRAGVGKSGKQREQRPVEAALSYFAVKLMKFHELGLNEIVRVQ